MKAKFSELVKRAVVGAGAEVVRELQDSPEGRDVLQATVTAAGIPYVATAPDSLSALDRLELVVKAARRARGGK